MASSKAARSTGGTSAKNGKVAAACTGTNNNPRTRDPGEFARDAALEAQRPRDIIQKLPPTSYSNLAQFPRTKSRLSLLFRPDSMLFSEGHLYRTMRSSQDILARNWSAPVPPPAMAAVSKRAGAVGPAVNAESVSSMKSKTGVVPDVRRQSNTSSQQQRGGYRPRIKPEDAEIETDSGDEYPEDVIQVSSSVAQRKLAAIMGNGGVQLRSKRPSPSRITSHPVPPTQTLVLPQPVSRTTTVPVLMHPYLPDPAPLQTPHTIRRKIISEELDEELRRNLLWERSQNQIQGRPPRAPGSILPGPWRPLTHSEENVEAQTNASDKVPGKRPFAMQRTKSWAGEFHASGW
ncbi:hypothetical protein K439DRAFT_592862 [Ramaria rubella]|nr:hypothetical protein K439DRAFT_592862 [Ramaria rubella]